MDEIIRKYKETKQFKIEYRNMKQVEISIGAFADDVVIMAKGRKKLKETLKNGIKMEDEKINIKIENMQIEQIENFQYVGVEIVANEKQKNDKHKNRKNDETILLICITS